MKSPEIIGTINTGDNLKILARKLKAWLKDSPVNAQRAQSQRQSTPV